MVDQPHKQTSVAAAPRRVLLAGATGYIGRAVAQMLKTRGFEVVAVLREADGERPDAQLAFAALAGCEQRVVALTEPAATMASLTELRVDAVISCLASRTGVGSDAWAVDHGANVNLLRAAEAAGAGHFVLLSAICVQKPLLEFQRAKLAFEAELAASPLAHTIVRPTAFFKSLAGQLERVQAGKAYLVFGDGSLTACKPISEADLASYLVDCLEKPERWNRILPVGGPGPALTPREQGELIFRLAGRAPQFREVPLAMFNVMDALLTPLGRLSKACAAKAELARIGRYYATESMLVWDEEAGRYDADATPSYGKEKLEAFFARALEEGLEGQALGAHKLF